MIQEKNIYINDDDYIIQKMLSTNWFEDTKKQYSNIIFENIKLHEHDDLTLLDIGSHLGLWTIRISERCKIFDIDFKGYLYEPSAKNVECLRKNVENINVEIYNNVVGSKDVYMSPAENENMGSFDISEEGVKVKHKIPDHKMSGFKIIILPCMSSDFNILKLFEKTYLTQKVLIVAQLIEKNLMKNNQTRKQVIDFMIRKKFKYKKYDLNFKHLDPHLEHTFFVFYNE